MSLPKKGATGAGASAASVTTQESNKTTAAKPRAQHAHVVLLEKVTTGTTVVFGKCPSQREAELLADRLLAIGCRARVEAAQHGDLAGLTRCQRVAR